MIRFARIAATTALLATTLGTASAEQWIFRGGTDPVYRNIRAFGNQPAAGQTTLFAATLGGGIIKTIDLGTSFTGTGQVNAGLPSKRIRAVNGFGSVPGILYAATEAHGVYRSPDAGASGWTAVNGSGGTALPCLSVRNLTVVSNTEVYAVTGCQYNSGVYRTTDSGATWTNVATSGIPDDVAVNSISLDVATVYVASSNYGILKGTVGGAFAPSNGTGANVIPDQGGPGRVNVFNVIVRSPVTTLLAYSPGSGVYRSMDSGLNWLPVNTNLPALYSHGGISGDGAGNFYLGLEKLGIWVTANNGDTWSLWGESNNNFYGQWSRGLTRDGLSGRFYISSLAGFARTTNGISFANPQNAGDPHLADSSVSSIVMFPGGRRAWVTVEQPVLINNIHQPLAQCSVDCPMELGNNLPGATIDQQIALDPVDSNTVYVATNYHGLWKSTNTGASWAHLANLPTASQETVRFNIASENNQVILAGLSNPFSTATGGGIYKSMDAGATWTAISTGLNNPDARNVNRITVPGNGAPPYLAATDGGLYRSVDGATWSLVYSALDGGGKLLGSGFATRHRTNTQLYYAANDHANADGTVLASSGVLRSTDGGTTWTNVLPSRRVRQVRIEGDGTVWAVLHRDSTLPQVMRSTNGGDTWSPYSTGLPAGEARNLGQLGAPSFKVIAVNDTTGIYTEKPQAKLLADFDGNGTADITWRDPNGQAAMWLMNGTTTTAMSLLLGPATGWTVLENDADFNADGFKDLLWVHTNGSLAIWLMNGITPIGSALVFGGGGGWQVSHIGDFNADGRTDLVFKDANGQVALWLMNGLAPQEAALVFGGGTTWLVKQVDDFNGDGNSDLLFQDAGGQVALWLMSGTTMTGSALIYAGGAGFTIAGMGDFNGDGIADIVFTGPGNAVAIWLMNGLSALNTGVVYGGGSFQLAYFGDFDGDGRSDLLFNDGAGQVAIWLMNGLSPTNAGIVFTGGGGWNVARVSDFDGDGRSDIMFAGAGGKTALWMMNGLSPTSIGVIFDGTGGWVIQPD